MTFKEFEDKLRDAFMFSTQEIERTMRSMGQSTLGSFIVACELDKYIELSGEDIDDLISHFQG